MTFVALKDQFGRFFQANGSDFWCLYRSLFSKKSGQIGTYSYPVPEQKHRQNQSIVLNVLFGSVPCASFLRSEEFVNSLRLYTRHEKTKIFHLQICCETKHLSNQPPNIFVLYIYNKYIRSHKINEVQLLVGGVPHSRHSDCRSLCRSGAD